jgi:hypothetical protein
MPPNSIAAQASNNALPDSDALQMSNDLRSLFEYTGGQQQHGTGLNDSTINAHRDNQEKEREAYAKVWSGLF